MTSKSNDPLEFDPSAETVVLPTPAPQQKPADESAFDPFADEPPPSKGADATRIDRPSAAATQVGPAPKKSGSFKLDFSELGDEHEVRKSARGTSQVIDTQEFMSREEKEAMARAKAGPRGEMPSLIEAELRASPVRVVHENRSIWYWFAGVVLLLLIAAIATAAVISRNEDERVRREVEQLKASMPTNP